MAGLVHSSVTGMANWYFFFRNKTILLRKIEIVSWDFFELAKTCKMGNNFKGCFPMEEYNSIDGKFIALFLLEMISVES